MLKESSSCCDPEETSRAVIATIAARAKNIARLIVAQGPVIGRAFDREGAAEADASKFTIFASLTRYFVACLLGSSAGLT